MRKNIYIFFINLGGNRQNIHIQLCEVLSESQLAIILNGVPEKYWNEFYYYYFGDILRSIHHVPHHKATNEYEVLLMLIIFNAIL